MMIVMMDVAYINYTMSRRAPKAALEQTTEVATARKAVS